MALGKSNASSNRVYYGWWIVLAAFLNLFFVVGIIFYGFPVFYPYFVESLGFTRAQVTQGFFLGFLFAGLPFGVLAGTLIDRIGARFVILAGVGLVGIPLLLMGAMNRFWQFEVLCIVEVIGYVLAGPIANQVLIAQWFQRRRGQAMGYAYLGLGLGGVVAPMSINFLARSLGWRHALELVGTLILLVLFPIGILVTRSSPQESRIAPEALGETPPSLGASPALMPPSVEVSKAVRSALLAHPRRFHSDHRRNRRGDPTLYFVSNGRRLLGYRCVKVFYDSAGSKLGRPGNRRPPCGPFSEGVHHGCLLFLDRCVRVLTRLSSLDCHLMVLRPGVWIFDGCRLHADSSCDFRLLWHGFSRQTSRAHYHGILHWPMGVSVPRRKTL